MTDAPRLEPHADELGTDELLKLYSLMVRTRQLDVAAIAWQRQGILPGYAPELGQEAAQVGSAYALDFARDFAFPTYREMGVALAAGVDMVEYMSTHKASWHGGLWNPAETHVAPIQAVVAGSVLHAVGWAHGQTVDGTGNVALTYFGDGASSQGDVHEAMNFASVYKAPVVFFTQNNGWAISVPTERQVAGGSVAARGAGYAIPSIQVDGNDVVAVVRAVRAAVEHGRAGNGPAMVEAMTYRRGPHSTSDDPGRYRSLDDERRDGGEDPLNRLEATLREAGALDDATVADISEQAGEFVEQVRLGVDALDARPGTEMFDFVFQEPTEALAAQAANWREESEHV
ncbi:MAG: thiamine pyrophosphate-dependent enzyme [Arthrobacter sp.]|uniref:thiamine pyrophosphate-dependent enzyme n=1 Tax=unclassified Arthrobacter TaxID=235627 RepID=UPI00264DC196|nr:thiamine pyrophosphate-dependent enzyme [Micrococcaceae bacterium]MDN5813986.1 thiamine pyrophosphate-dependent enzyme [Micrococcaceae bacterium]MDN5824049.1 thiamine pyrophosphate-dependent enzyme [Micrococcaceae bacterium]MDN5878966.1 thiamine pyrophosphate-dependent enzyme [Micrococcaceae bacterium]MDN5887722.1 thiamine pyrophosphate-dependent enzyme [Micrococcaceae bacterium]